MGNFTKIWEAGGRFVTKIWQTGGKLVCCKDDGRCDDSSATDFDWIGESYEDCGRRRWNGLSGNDKPIVRTAADVLVGEETVDKGLKVAGEASDKVDSMMEKVGENMESISSSVSGASSAWGGIGSFLKDMLGGNGLNMFGNFFGNIGKGNVSGLSMLGLVASSLLVFGRFGWLGKIAGALMGMMLIGSNSRGIQTEQPSQSESQDVQRNGGMRR